MVIRIFLRPWLFQYITQQRRIVDIMWRECEPGVRACLSDTPTILAGDIRAYIFSIIHETAFIDPFQHLFLRRQLLERVISLCRGHLHRVRSKLSFMMQHSPSSQNVSLYAHRALFAFVLSHIQLMEMFV